MTKFSVLLMLFVFNISIFVQAQEPVLAGRNFDETKEAEVTQIARKRLYPGGKDESDLKVQTELTNPVRKITPSLVLTVDPEPGAED